MLARIWMLRRVVLTAMLTLHSSGMASAVERPAGSVVITGELQNPVFLTFDQLEALPLQSQSLTVSFQAGSAVEQHTFTGFLLYDVLNFLKPQFDPTVKNDRLRFYVSATGTDGYQAIVAWGEFDPFFGNKQILLAVTQDAQSLAPQGPRLVVPGDIRGGRYVSLVDTIRLDRARQPQCPDDPVCGVFPFTAVRRAADINVGDDLGGTGHMALNFMGSAGAGGDTWIAAYNPTSPSPTTFGNVSLSADVLIHQHNNTKGAGLLSLFNQATGKKGLAVIVYDAGASDSIALATVDQAGKLVTLSSVGLGSGIQTNTWYHVTVGVVVNSAAVSITGKVFKHKVPTDPNSEVDGQVGGAVTFSGPRPAGVDATGEVGILTSAFSALTDSSVVNFSVAP